MRKKPMAENILLRKRGTSVSSDAKIIILEEKN